MSSNMATSCSIRLREGLLLRADPSNTMAGIPSQNAAKIVVRVLNRATVQPEIVTITDPGRVTEPGLKVQTPPILLRSSLPVMPVPETNGQEKLPTLVPVGPLNETGVRLAPPGGIVIWVALLMTVKARVARCINPLLSCAVTVTV